MKWGTAGRKVAKSDRRIGKKSHISAHLNLDLRCPDWHNQPTVLETAILGRFVPDGAGAKGET